MTIQVDHMLLTRFNLPSAGVESTFRARDGWLKGRVELFERYCLPSVQAQTNRSFSWIIYFDPQSPPWLRSWIDDRHVGMFTPIFRSQVSPDDLKSDTDMAFPNKSRELITTNLDNDDGLAFDFIDRLQALTPPRPRVAIYLSQGLIMRSDELYLRTDRENAFCSVRESWDEPVTCWSDWHNRLSLSMPSLVVRGQPAWLQVVHDDNVSNRVRGRLVSPSPYRRNFIGLQALPEPTTRSLWVDRVGKMPLRVAKNTTRSTLRRAAVRVLGKDTVNEVKMKLARGDRA